MNVDRTAVYYLYHFVVHTFALLGTPSPALGIFPAIISLPHSDGVRSESVIEVARVKIAILNALEKLLSRNGQVRGHFDSKITPNLTPIVIESWFWTRPGITCVSSLSRYCNFFFKSCAASAKKRKRKNSTRLSFPFLIGFRILTIIRTWKERENFPIFIIFFNCYSRLYETALVFFFPSSRCGFEKKNDEKSFQNFLFSLFSRCNIRVDEKHAYVVLMKIQFNKGYEKKRGKFKTRIRSKLARIVRRQKNTNLLRTNYYYSY